ncbi:unnamed protein product [Rotaria socialis]|uniref:EF-hand domain-containing protein n=2 Tax=Rotaria socialis TaxID=392032 RepID=A0A817XDW5_9BILA|nr:unnamed protein product [Rotaria socialis]CAF3365565.1 unnamed protein product [Rotaria socialis]CAF3366029.1 unnamed protein product [Rotaria socialis]CAF3371328.1 unnamed protein product [Rotaria socialis]CAF3722798.1 unnamed protein product [Rotaria socialis]
MDADLAEKLNRRIRRIESVESSSETSSTTGNGLADDIDLTYPLTNYESQRSNAFNPYIEYNEFSRKQIQNLMQTFDKYDIDGDKSLNFNELKFMMEKLGIPQTHLGLKEMIKQVDEDRDGKISFREFLLIFRKAILENNDRECEASVLYKLYAMLFEIDVSKEGVGGAKQFFEAKIAAIKDSDKFQREIRDEQEQRRQMEEEKIRRKSAFQSRLAHFQMT